MTKVMPGSRPAVSRPVPIVPPGGFAGNAQQTGVTQLIFAKASGRRGGVSSGRRRRRKKAARSSRSGGARRRRTTRATRAGRMVKGSAAAKRHMARLRKMRRK